MVDGPLNHALKTDGLLENIFFLGVNLGEFFIKKLFQFLFDLLRVSPAFLYGIRTGFMVQDRVKNMLYTDIFVPSFLASLTANPRAVLSSLLIILDLLLFHGAFQRKSPGGGQVMDRLNFGFSDFSGINTTHCVSFIMYIKHSLRCFFKWFSKNRHQYLHHKFHGGVIVIVENDPVLRRLIFPRFLGDDRLDSFIGGRHCRCLNSCSIFCISFRCRRGRGRCA